MSDLQARQATAAVTLEFAILTAARPVKCAAHVGRKLILIAPFGPYRHGA